MTLNNTHIETAIARQMLHEAGETSGRGAAAQHLLRLGIIVFGHLFTLEDEALGVNSLRVPTEAVNDASRPTDEALANYAIQYEGILERDFDSSAV